MQLTKRQDHAIIVSARTAEPLQIALRFGDARGDLNWTEKPFLITQTGYISQRRSIYGQTTPIARF